MANNIKFGIDIKAATSGQKEVKDLSNNFATLGRRLKQIDATKANASLAELKKKINQIDATKASQSLADLRKKIQQLNTAKASTALAEFQNKLKEINTTKAGASLTNLKSKIEAINTAKASAGLVNLKNKIKDIDATKTNASLGELKQTIQQVTVRGEGPGLRDLKKQIKDIDTAKASANLTNLKKRIREIDSTKTGSTFADLKNKIKSVDNIEFGGVLKRLAAVAAAAFTVQKAFNFAAQGVEFNAAKEQVRTGIASLIATFSDITDKTGESLEGIEKYTASLSLAEDQLDKLAIQGLETAATTRELQDAFKIAVGPGRNAKLTLDQIRSSVVLITQAATALGVPLRELNTEIRSIFNGDVNNPEASVAKLFSKEEIDNAIKLGTLADLIGERLAFFGLAAKESAKNFTTLRSNAGEALELFRADVTKPLFDGLKRGLIEFNSIFDANTLEISERFDGIAESLRSLFETVGEGVSDGVESGLDSIAQFGDFLIENKQTFSEIADNFGQTADNIADIFSTFSGAGNTILALLKTLGQGLALFSAGFSDLASLIPNSIQLKIGKLQELVGTALAISGLDKGNLQGRGRENQKTAQANIDNRFKNSSTEKFSDSFFSEKFKGDVVETQPGGERRKKIREGEKLLKEEEESIRRELRTNKDLLEQKLLTRAEFLKKEQELQKRFVKLQKDREANRNQFKDPELDGLTDKAKSLRNKKDTEDKADARRAEAEARKLADARLKLAVAEADANFQLKQAGLDKEQQLNKENLDLQLIGQREFLEEKARLDKAAIDLEITREKEKIAELERSKNDPARKESDKVALQADLVKTRSELKKLEDEKAKVDAILKVEIKLDEKSKAEFLNEVQLGILEAQGLDKEAQLARLDVEFNRQLNDPNNSASREDLERLKNLKAQRIEYEATLATLDELRQKRQLDTEELDRELARGTIGQQEYNRQLQALNLETAASFEGVLAEAEAYAAAIGDKKLTAALAQLRGEVKGLKEPLDQIGKTIRDSLENGIANAFSSILDGTKSFGDALKGVLLGILQTIQDILVKQIAAQLATTLGGAGGGGGFIGALVGAASGGLGFASGGLVTGPGTGTSDSIPARLSNGEFVINAATVRKVGVGFLNNLNSSRGFATGGLVGEGGAAAAVGGMGSVVINNITDPKDIENFITSSKGENAIVNIIKRNERLFR